MLGKKLTQAAAGNVGGPTTDLAVAHNNSPFITVYSWSASGFGAKYSDPSTLPDSSRCFSVDFSYNFWSSMGGGGDGPK